MTRLLATALTALLVQTAAGNDLIPEATRDQRKDPRDTIAVALKTLEGLERDGTPDFLRSFTAPDLVKRLEPNIGRVSASFYQRKRSELIAELKAAQAVAPELSENGSEAVFVYDGPIKSRNTPPNSPTPGFLTRLKLQKVGDYWYIVS